MLINNLQIILHNKQVELTDPVREYFGDWQIHLAANDLVRDLITSLMCVTPW